MTRKREQLLDDAMECVGALFQQRRRSLAASPDHSRGVSMPQLYVLMLLLDVERSTVSEIARFLHVSAPSASSLLDRLEERNLLARERDRDDRRVVLVRLTGAGRTLVEELIGMKREAAQNLLIQMTDEELHHVVGAAQALLRVTQEPEKPTSNAGGPQAAS